MIQNSLQLTLPQQDQQQPIPLIYWEYFSKKCIYQLWESSRFLIYLLINKEINVSKEIVVDFSCGVGMVGVVCAILGSSKCIFTDLFDEHLTKTVERNIIDNIDKGIKTKLNAEQIEKQTNSSSKALQEVLEGKQNEQIRQKVEENEGSQFEYELLSVDWIELLTLQSQLQEEGNSISKLQQANTVFMSDLFYDETNYDVLFCLIASVFKDKQVFIAYQERGNLDPLFAYAQGYGLELQVFAHSSNTKYIQFNLSKEIVVYLVKQTSPQLISLSNETVSGEDQTTACEEN